MARDKTEFTCSDCGTTSPKWLGKCPGCGAWNTLVEGAAEPAGGARHRFQALARSAPVTTLAEIEASDVMRTPTGQAGLQGLGQRGADMRQHHQQVANAGGQQALRQRQQVGRLRLREGGVAAVGVARAIEHHHAQRHLRVGGLAERFGIHRLQPLHGGVEVAHDQHAHRREGARGEQRFEHGSAERAATAGDQHALPRGR